MSKKFSDMTTEEIEAMSDAEFKAVSPFEKKSCHDCAHIVPAMSLYCGNIAAVSARGTSLPGCIRCPYWEPNFDYIDAKYRTKKNGYVPLVDQLVNSIIPPGSKKWWQFWKW